MDRRGGVLVSDADYVARVRRHKPSSLIPIVAQVGAAVSEPGSWRRGDISTAVNPWALADVARVSLVSGNEHRQPATSSDLSECLAAYWRLDEPRQEPDAVMSFLSARPQSSSDSTSLGITICSVQQPYSHKRTQ